jgi:hypothetical protein
MHDPEQGWKAPNRWEKSGLDATFNIGSCAKPDADCIFGNNHKMTSHDS